MVQWITDYLLDFGSLKNHSHDHGQIRIKQSMKTFKASEFKARCLSLMDEVARTGEEIIITKNGVPVSKLVPFYSKPKTLFGLHKGKVSGCGDIISPLEETWEANT